MDKKLHRYLEHRRTLQFFIVLFLNMVTTLTSGILLAEVTRRLIAVIMARESMDSLLCVFGILIVGLAGCSFVSSILSARVKQAWINTSEDQVIMVLETQSFSCYTGKKDYFSLIRNTVRQLCDATFSYETTYVTTVLAALASILYIGLSNPLMLVISLVICAVVNLISYLHGKNLSQLQNELNQSMNRLTEIQWEHITNRKIQPFLKSDHVLNGYHKFSESQYKLWVSVKKRTVIASVFNQFGSVITILFCISIALAMPEIIKITIPELAALFIVIPQMTKALFAFPKLANDKQRILGMQKTLETETSLSPYDTRSRKNLAECISSVEFHDIRCEINNALILNDFNTRLNKGNIYVITGAPGSGKSTLLKLICQLYPSTRGEILINGNNSLSINRSDIWNNIAYIPQTPLLFPTSIEDNIIMDEIRDEKKLTEVAQAVGIEHLINRDADVETLSTGEVQKLAFARVFYGNKNLLLLDEATSALDPAAESQILSELCKRRDDCIIVFATHRSAAIDIADNIISLKISGDGHD